ncbi:unnamed protein product [Blepharisma stoltei]|uniref:C2H2-type domain-containing protein n=1 Tax=Blepharisma stoltei TaxID=1481888 RepID=A0AAU9J6I1_9CILI|nr:unnamed protein product [Blepharisma stoltei]
MNHRLGNLHNKLAIMAKSTIKQSPLRDLKCNVAGCGKVLSSKYNLKRHIESCHYGYKPYECPHCFKRFSSKQNKREHTKLEHASIKLPKVPKRQENSPSVNINIPLLTTLIILSSDPDIRPLSRYARIYLFGNDDIFRHPEKYIFNPIEESLREPNAKLGIPKELDSEGKKVY